MKTQTNKANAASGLLSVVAGMLVAFLLLLSPLAANAQNYAGSVRGTVTDPAGAAVPGAEVTLRDVGTNETSQAKTNEQGEYAFPVVNVGVYEVTVKHGSFKEFIAKDVEVHVSTPTEVNAKLELGSSSEVVSVEASDIQVQTTTADVGAVIEGTQVRELPLNGRNFLELTQLQPGVSANNQFDSKDKGLQGGSDFSVNGNPSTNNLFLIDGVNNNDVGSNRTILIYPSVDSIAEFKMLTNSYGPEYGQASGAIISITTRSGENTLHGGLFYEGRNDKLDANNFFNNQKGVAKPPLRRNDWGYYIAGPIKKDKLFFWWNEEWNRDIRGNLITTCAPTAAERAGDFSADVATALNSLEQWWRSQRQHPMHRAATGHLYEQWHCHQPELFSHFQYSRRLSESRQPICRCESRCSRPASGCLFSIAESECRQLHKSQRFRYQFCAKPEQQGSLAGRKRTH